MAVKDIQDKILEEAKVKAEEIADDLKQKIAEVEKETDRLKAELKKQAEKDLEQKKESSMAVEVSRAKQKGSIDRQVLKRKTLEKVYQEALTKIAELDSEKYAKFLAKNMGELELSSDEKWQALVPAKRLAESKKVLDSLGLSHVEIVPDNNIDIGVLIKGKGCEYDLSGERVKSKIKSETEVEISSLLFGKAK